MLTLNLTLIHVDYCDVCNLQAHTTGTILHQWQCSNHEEYVWNRLVPNHKNAYNVYIPSEVLNGPNTCFSHTPHETLKDKWGLFGHITYGMFTTIMIGMVMTNNISQESGNGGFFASWQGVQYLNTEHGMKYDSLLCLVMHIEAETKWTPFRRRHLQVHFLEWKCLNSD